MTASKTHSPEHSRIHLIAIGSSTGGVPCVSRILSRLPQDCPPVLVVQHMPWLYTRSFAARLNGHCCIDVHEVRDGEILTQGTALVAQWDAHLSVREDGGYFAASVSEGPKVIGPRPSIDHMFESCARAAGENCIAVILAGMGKDGATGMRTIKDARVSSDEETAKPKAEDGEASPVAKPTLKWRQHTWDREQADRQKIDGKPATVAVTERREFAMRATPVPSRSNDNGGDV